MESSIRGYVLRKIIANLSSDRIFGKKITSGELRKNMVEPPWKCPQGYEWKKIDLEKCQMEYLLPLHKLRQDYVILQLHGGGYIGRMKNAYRSFAHRYSQISQGMGVLTVDYRVAPEFPYPAALEDALEAFDWLVAQGFEEKQIIIAGDSAGGGLALAVSLYLKDRGRQLPKALILMSPWADLTAQGNSYTENYTKDPLFGNTKDSMIYNSVYVQGEDPKNPYISPIFGDLSGFPPVLIQVGSLEMLLSDSVTVAEKIKDGGGKVYLNIYEGMFHLFQMAMDLLPEAVQAWKEIEKFLLHIH